MPKAKLLHNYEQVAPCIRPPVKVPTFLVSWFPLLNMPVEQSFFHFIHCHLMLNPDLLFDFESNLQFIKVHITTPAMAILSCFKEQSRRKGEAKFRLLIPSCISCGNLLPVLRLRWRVAGPELVEGLSTNGALVCYGFSPFVLSVAAPETKSKDSASAHSFNVNALLPK